MKLHIFTAYAQFISEQDAYEFYHLHGGEILEIIDPLGGAYVFAVGRFENV